MSALKDEIRQGVREEIGTLLKRIESLTRAVEELTRSQGDTVNIEQACELLKCSDTTFWRYRTGPDKLIEPCGGTETRPVFYKADVLAIRQRIKEHKHKLRA